MSPHKRPFISISPPSPHTSIRNTKRGSSLISHLFVSLSHLSSLISSSLCLTSFVGCYNLLTPLNNLLTYVSPLSSVAPVTRRVAECRGDTLGWGTCAGLPPNRPPCTCGKERGKEGGKEGGKDGGKEGGKEEEKEEREMKEISRCCWY